jgi:hypothetical protein
MKLVPIRLWVRGGDERRLDSFARHEGRGEGGKKIKIARVGKSLLESGSINLGRVSLHVYMCVFMCQCVSVCVSACCRLYAHLDDHNNNINSIIYTLVCLPAAVRLVAALGSNRLTP